MKGLVRKVLLSQWAHCAFISTIYIWNSSRSVCSSPNKVCLNRIHLREDKILATVCELMLWNCSILCCLLYICVQQTQCRLERKNRIQKKKLIGTLQRLAYKVLLRKYYFFLSRPIHFITQISKLRIHIACIETNTGWLVYFWLNLLYAMLYSKSLKINNH